jgi:isoleucyl-tRNA synthetase
MEPARKQKLVGNAQEAAVEIEVAEEALIEATVGLEEELEEVLLLSHLVIRKGEQTVARVRTNPDKRCARCWRHKPSVGRSALHSELCDRCEDVLGSASL